MAGHEQASASIASAEALLITAGAGMGVDSGLPDFRGPEGFWRAYPALARLGLRFEQMANPAWFDRDPELAWAFYGHRLNLYRSTNPHVGFHQLLEIARSKTLGYFVFTSNVDGHFQTAGFNPDFVAECHGSIHHFQCLRPCARSLWDAPAGPIEIEEDLFRARPPLPRCPHCGLLARPNILMFGDGRWIRDRTAAQEQRLNQWLTSLLKHRAKLAVIELGAGTAIPTVRHFSETIVEDYGATLIRVNPRESDGPTGTYSVPYSAKAGLELLLRTQ